VCVCVRVCVRVCVCDDIGPVAGADSLGRCVGSQRVFMYSIFRVSERFMYSRKSQKVLCILESAIYSRKSYVF